jgi:hypothetical protein
VALESERQETEKQVHSETNHRVKASYDNLVDPVCSVCIPYRKWLGFPWAKQAGE